jgi:hypothetical protein
MQGGSGGRRERSGSISGRLRSVSDLCDEGVLTVVEKGAIKDLIIVGAGRLEACWEALEEGDVGPLKAVANACLSEPPLDFERALDIDVLTVEDGSGEGSQARVSPGLPPGTGALGAGSWGRCRQWPRSRGKWVRWGGGHGSLSLSLFFSQFVDVDRTDTHPHPRPLPLPPPPTCLRVVSLPGLCVCWSQGAASGVCA